MSKESQSAHSGDGLPGDLLRLDLQLCFRLYAASRLITRLYQPLLEPMGITYAVHRADDPVGGRALLGVAHRRPCPAQHQRCPPCSSGSNSRAWCCACVHAELVAAPRFPNDKAETLATLLDDLLAGLAEQAGPKMS